MKTIIEKLGIESVKPMIGKSKDGIEWEFSFHDVVVELEQQRNDLLDNSIKFLREYELNVPAQFTDDDIYYATIDIIEKADPEHRSWQQIKEIVESSE